MSCGSLSNVFCSTCDRVGLHDKGICVHCDTKAGYTPIRDDPSKGLEFSMKRQIAVKKRRKGGRPRKAKGT